MKKKYQIFISSTYIDLKEERQAVSNAILKIHQFPVGMEQFNAGNARQWEAIKESIDTSDYSTSGTALLYKDSVLNSDKSKLLRVSTKLIVTAK